MESTPPSRIYRPRLVDPLLRELVQEFPAILITGPRAVGKTTTARQVCADQVRLDQPGEAAAFLADPDAALSGRGRPLLLDEWQEVPDVLGAIKRAVDNDSTPGQFVLTGSVRAELATPTWPGTGRIVRLTMSGLSERELTDDLDPAGIPFLERLATLDADVIGRVSEALTLPDYVSLAVRGGFPEVVDRSTERAQRIWLRSYLDQMITRDAADLVRGADAEKMRTYFEVLSLNTAGSPSDKTLYDAAGINARTAARYDQVFERLFLTERVTPWFSNRLKRLEKGAKRYVLDPGLAASAGNLDVQSILGEADLFGRLLDTFAMSQLRPEIAVGDRPARIHHLRTNSGRQEVDIIVELPGNSVMAIEVKASAKVGPSDCRHLMWLRDQLGAGFVAGVVLHTGPEVFHLADRILAVPISSMWAAT